MQTPWFTGLPFFHLINYAPRQCYHAAHFEKDTRYYVVRLSKDLLDDWVITLINGRIKSRLGQSRTLAFANFSEGFDHFCALAKIRYQRGYKLKTLACDNNHLLHLLPFLVNTKDKKELFVFKTVKSPNQCICQKKAVSNLSHSSLQETSQQLGFAF